MIQALLYVIVSALVGQIALVVAFGFSHVMRRLG